MSYLLTEGNRGWLKAFTFGCSVQEVCFSYFSKSNYIHCFYLMFYINKKSKININPLYNYIKRELFSLPNHVTGVVMYINYTKQLEIKKN